MPSHAGTHKIQAYTKSNADSNNSNDSGDAADTLLIAEQTKVRIGAATLPIPAVKWAHIHLSLRVQL
jgi:hypothetical protein